MISVGDDGCKMNSIYILFLVFLQKWDFFSGNDDVINDKGNFYQMLAETFIPFTLSSTDNNDI